MTLTRRILSLDGGGVRGVISLAFLERIEAICATQADQESPRLADHFDLIGGTSTGAIIGTALALGHSAREVRDIYFHLAPRVFQRRWRIPHVHHVFDSRQLRDGIVAFAGDRKLDSADLRTHIAVIVKRLDTGSAWIVTNCARSKYWDDPPDRSYIGNRNYRLAALLRASAAAPYFFAPERIEIAAGEPPGLFVDGAISPHYNPALALLQVATIPAYGFNWSTGAERLHIISVGTGSYRTRLDAYAAQRMMATGLAMRALGSIIADAETQVLTLMQALGRTDTPWVINSEIGDLADVLLAREPLFTFQRYDVRLEQNWLQKEVGLKISERDLERLRRMDLPSGIPLAYEIGNAAAERFVRAEHFLPDRRAASPSS